MSELIVLHLGVLHGHLCDLRAGQVMYGPFLFVRGSKAAMSCTGPDSQAPSAFSGSFLVPRVA